MISPFAAKVYELLQTVPKGKVTTYKELAHAMQTRAYRAIGQIMKSNPYTPLVPCHRVVSSDGAIGGFMGKNTGDAIKKKIALLEEEGISIKNNKIEHFEEKLHVFSSK